ncbi:hypothetical protein GCM10028812_53450 [Ancylobacter sonchi]
MFRMPKAARCLGLELEGGPPFGVLMHGSPTYRVGDNLKYIATQEAGPILSSPPLCRRRRPRLGIARIDLPGRVQVMPSTVIARSRYGEDTGPSRCGSGRAGAATTTAMSLRKTYAAYRAAISKGSYFNQFIRDRFPYRRTVQR